MTHLVDTAAASELRDVGAAVVSQPPDVVVADHLTKRFGSVLAVDDLSFRLEAGTVTGFIGPNGAGKTTTLRMLLGLVRPDAGTTLVFGRPYRELEDPARRVGAVLEAADFHPGRSGREHLITLALAARLPVSRVDDVLEMVGLTHAARRRVKTYSLGMRQRLGLAAALLGDPELLILDEPANGLDPAGIKEIRELLRSLGDEGRTVFVSSHLLVEIQHTCDRVAILTRGRCVATGTVEEVLERGHRTTLHVGVEDLAAGLDALHHAGIPATRNHTGLQVDLPASEAARVSEILARRELWVTELHADEATLEDVFLELTTAPALEEAIR
jgi:ABC-2 type transport system ATP-binding protein